MKKPIVIAVFLTLFLSSGNASIIEHNGYSLDTSTNIVSNGNLEWLRWDKTAGLSIDDANSLYASSGWRLASNQDMSGLFSSFFSGKAWDDDENTGQGFRYPWDVAEDSAAINLIELFGSTLDAAGASWGGDPNDMRNRTVVLFGSDLDADNLYNWLLIQDDFTEIDGSYVDGDARLQEDSRSASYKESTIGVALVRVVPEPSVLLLMGLGLIGLSFTRRHQKLAS